MLVSRRESLMLGLAFGAECLALAGCTSESADTTASSETDADSTSTDISLAPGEVVTSGEVQLDCESEQAALSVDDLKAWIKASVYDEEGQAAIKAELDATKDGQTLAAPLVVYNPFGTDAQSIYVYFLTESETSVSYTVSTSAEEAGIEVEDFTREVDGGQEALEHEFKILGLIPNATNTVTVSATYANGAVENCVITCSVGDVLGDEELQLQIDEGESDADLETGLYVILGNDDSNADFIYFYDNQGILRSEVPIIGYRAHRLLFDDAGTTYFSISQAAFAAMSSLGQIVGVYDLGDYRMHHDYVWDSDGNIIFLATYLPADTVEDMVATLDVETGEVTLTLDMGDLLGSYKTAALAYHEAYATENRYAEGTDWMHINTVQYLADEDAVILSSRETSTIIKVGSVHDDPRLEYLLASSGYWEGTGYEDYVYEQVGSFTIHGGQHSVTYVEDDALEDGQYYLAMFDNNIGISHDTTSGFDWTSVGLMCSSGTSDWESSYYYKYLVDENAGTFELVEQLEVPYSGYVSGVQFVGENLIVDSGSPGVFTEYDADLVAIRTFTMDVETWIYRVFKYDL